MIFLPIGSVRYEQAVPELGKACAIDIKVERIPECTTRRLCLSTQSVLGGCLSHKLKRCLLNLDRESFWGTRSFLGDYDKTYGPSSDSVETSVRKRLDEPEKQYHNSLSMSPQVSPSILLRSVTGFLLLLP